MPDTTLKTAKPFMAPRRPRVAPLAAVPVPAMDTTVAASLAKLHPQLVVETGEGGAACASTIQMLYLAERYAAVAKTTVDSQEKADVMAVFQAMRDSVTASIAVKGVVTSLACPCWRFSNGHAAYFGPVAYRDEGSDRLRMGPQSIFLPPTEAQASWTQETIAAVWGRWSEDEQQVYVECRLEGLRVAREWFAATYPGQDIEGDMSNVELRLMVAQYAANAVDRYRAWRGAVQEN